jgi:hypothetical protein
MTVKQSTGGDSLHGSKTVGTTSAQMTTIGTRELAKGVLVKAAAANTGTVYVGSEAVTAAGADSNSGFPLAASESLFIPTDELNLWIVGSAADQKVFWIAR